MEMQQREKRKFQQWWEISQIKCIVRFVTAETQLSTYFRFLPRANLNFSPPQIDGPRELHLSYLHISMYNTYHFIDLYFYLVFEKHVCTLEVLRVLYHYVLPVVTFVYNITIDCY